MQQLASIWASFRCFRTHPSVTSCEREDIGGKSRACEHWAGSTSTLLPTRAPCIYIYHNISYCNLYEMYVWLFIHPIHLCSYFLLCTPFSETLEISYSWSHMNWLYIYIIIYIYIYIYIPMFPLIPIFGQAIHFRHFAVLETPQLSQGLERLAPKPSGCLPLRRNGSGEWTPVLSNVLKWI